MSRRRSIRLVLLLLVGLISGSPLAVQADETARAAAIPAKIVAGKLVVSCDVSTRFRRIPVTLFIELETRAGFQLHNRAAAGIRAENPDGTANPITIHLPDLDIKVPRRELGPEKLYEDFTKYYSPEIGEVALVGTIGAEILKQYHVTFDLHNGLLHLGPPAEASEDAADAVEGSVTLPTTFTNDLIWCTTRFGDGLPGAVALGCARYDTVIDRDVCEKRRKPAGDVGSLLLGDATQGEIDLSKYVAFRPEEVKQVHADGVVGVTGLNLLKHFRVEIDRTNAFVRLTETAPAEFPEEDLAFFRARVEEDGDAIEAFLDKYPKARLANEAAELLVRLRLAEDADDEVFSRALTYVNDAVDETLRATVMLDLMEVLAEEGRSPHVLAAGRIGIESGRKDRYPNAVHKIHGRMGRVLLDGGRGKEAWRHLLSAAFGMPEDGLVNLDLGRFYEESGRIRRAYSRYVQAVIQPESGPKALEGLQRLQTKLPGGERFSVDLVERLIAGKVENFGVATKYSPEKDAPAGHVVLCEFFTNAHLEAAIGGALANEGVLAHFPREHVAMLSYHLPVPRMDPLVNELAVETATRRDVTDPVVHVFDGLDKGPGAGRSRFKERIYNRLRRQVLDRIALDSPFTLRCEAKLEGDTVSGNLIVEGPKRRGTTVQLVLAEKGVLFPGKSKVVIHRMLARGSMLGTPKGMRYKPTDGKMEISFSRTLDEIRQENEAYLKRLEAGGAGTVSIMSTTIDPAQVTLVAYVRGATGQIVQALQLEPVRGE